MLEAKRHDVISTSPIMESHDTWFLIAMGLCFVVFAKPYGRALGHRLEGPWTEQQREDHTRRHTLVARVLGGALIVYSMWRLFVR